MNGDQKPFVDPTDLKPEEWQAYLKNAMTALRQNPKDREALQAIRDANQALSVYDEAEAASPSERISSGISGGMKGLGQAALDIPRAVLTPSMWSHIARPTKEDVSTLLHAITRGDQEQVGHAVGNIGTAAIPFAKIGARGSFSLGNPNGPTVADAAVNLARGAKAHIGQVARAPLELAERPGLSNKLTKLRIAEAEARAAQRATPPEQPSAELPGRAEPPIHPDAARAVRDYEAGKISGEDLTTALDVAAGRTPAEPVRAAQLPVEGEVSASAPPLEPIPGQPKGFTVEGPPTPPAPSAPTVAEMQSGVRNDPVAQQLASLKPGTRAPGGGTYVEPGPFQKAGPPIRVQSPKVPGTASPEAQMQLIQEFLKGTTRETLPSRVASLKDMGMLTEEQARQILEDGP